MAETVFCYHCRAYHPLDKVRRVSTASGKRWRCIKSIDATKRSAREREAFGQQITTLNRMSAESRKNRSVPQCVMERHPLVHGFPTISLA